MAEIKCENLSLGYRNNVLINNLNFEINKGDYLCIVGKNGAGKTTLMRTILHLQPVLSGNIIYSDGLIPSEIGYLPQQTVIQKDFPASVKEIVLSGCQTKLKRKFFYSKRDKALAFHNMKKLEIENLENKCYRELSGGQQQRVLLARALCATQRMILLDEPVSGLDPSATEKMYDLILKLNNIGITIVMISHDIFVALKYATKILHLGKENFCGTVKEYIDSEQGRKYLHSGGNNND